MCAPLRQNASFHTSMSRKQLFIRKIENNTQNRRRHTILYRKQPERQNKSRPPNPLLNSCWSGLLYLPVHPPQWIRQKSSNRLGGPQNFTSETRTPQNYPTINQKSKKSTPPKRIHHFYSSPMPTQQSHEPQKTRRPVCTQREFT